MNVNKIMAELERKHPGESEYLLLRREDREHSLLPRYIFPFH